MSQEPEQQLKILETRVRQLILAYRDMKARNAELEQTLAARDKAIEQLKTKVAAAETDYARLKAAKMMEISNGDLNEAKARMAQLVREVDKCIALLNV